MNEQDNRYLQAVEFFESCGIDAKVSHAKALAALLARSEPTPLGLQGESREKLTAALTIVDSDTSRRMMQTTDRLELGRLLREVLSAELEDASFLDQIAKLFRERDYSEESCQKHMLVATVHSVLQALAHYRAQSETP